MPNRPTFEVRAVFDDETVRVYQAYSPIIAEPALRAGRFVCPPFKLDRMTWIKPSFLWMMCRSRWATKPGQERVLGIDITRSGFEWALTHSCLSHYVADRHGRPEEWRRELSKSPVRIQWDPERDLRLNRLEHRSLQVGLRGEAVRRYVEEWVVCIEDLTPYCRELAEWIAQGRSAEAADQLPDERELPLSQEARRAIGAD